MTVGHIDVCGIAFVAGAHKNSRMKNVLSTHTLFFRALGSVSNTPGGAAMPAPSRYVRPLGIVVLALLVFQGCNALNPLCGSARPAPVIGSLSASAITFAEVQKGFLLTVNGGQFVSASVVVINGKTLSTLATSSLQLEATITTAVISGPGTASVTVNTPSGNSGDLGCSSGGTSHALILTIT